MLFPALCYFSSRILKGTMMPWSHLHYKKNFFFFQVVIIGFYVYSSMNFKLMFIVKKPWPQSEEISSFKNKKKPSLVFPLYSTFFPTLTPYNQWYNSQTITELWQCHVHGLPSTGRIYKVLNDGSQWEICRGVFGYHNFWRVLWHIREGTRKCYKIFL